MGADVVVLVDRTWLTPARAARLVEFGTGLRPERVFPTHVAYRVSGPAPPGPEVLTVEARIDGGRACAVLRNAGPGWMPLYPARRLTLGLTGSGGAPAPRVAWLPLDLAPGAEHVDCLESGTPTEISGTIEGGGRRFRFTVRPGEAAALREETGR